MRIAEKEFAEKPKVLKTVVDTFTNYYDQEPGGAAFPIRNWVTIPGTDQVTGTNLTINPANGAVFYRLTYGTP